jgi:predicted NBD/HSP70 family sugar kinase
MSGRGSNSVQVRHYNERVVLEALRRFGQASKAEIARFAHLTPPAVATIVGALEDGGYVKAGGRRFGGKGQPSAMFELSPDGAYSIGLHIGRRALDAVLIDFCGQVREFESHDHEYPAPEIVQRSADAVIHRFRKKLGPESGGRLVGIGVSAPYFIGGWDNELGFPVEVRAAWRKIDIASGFLDAGGLPVQVENDASAAAVAELVQGVGMRYQDFLHVSLTTFVGAGLVLDGTLQTGPHGNTAAFGPFPVTPSSLASVAKPSGPFEILLHRASIYTLLNHLRFGGVKILRVRELDPMPPEAAALVAEWLSDCAAALAQAIVGAIAVVDVEAIVIDGLLPRPLLLELVARTASEVASISPGGLIAPEILPGSLGPRASAIGASLLPIYALFGPDKGVLTKKAREKKPLMVGSIF